MSAACGSQVISDGSRMLVKRSYRRGVGVATAPLLDAGILCVSQRDHYTLALLRAHLDPGYVVPRDVRDHHEHPWGLEHFEGIHPRA